MNTRLRSSIAATAALGVVLGAAAVAGGSESAPAAASPTATPPAATSPAGGSAAARGLVLGGQGAAQPTTMAQFLTAVTEDTDRYWTKVFADHGLDEPRVSYAWIPAGQTAQSACGSDGMGDSAAAYCPADDTIYVSEKFATDIYTGALDRALPGSSRGYGRTVGDFAVAYIVAHEYGHQIQHELGLFERYGNQVPTAAFELQADCYAGAWANSAYQENRLEDGDVQEALDAALAVGDFDSTNPAHHGTPEQRAQAWNAGFENGNPGACSAYLTAA